MHTEDRLRPAISVIIPTLNASPAFREVLEKLQAQTAQPAEIIVVDSSSDDGTAELARQLGAAVYTIDRADFDHGGTRNLAASHAKGDILVFMTQDAVPANEHLLENLTRPLIENEQTACAYARQLAKPGAHLLEQLARTYNYPEQSLVKSQADLSVLGLKTFFCSNVCAAFRRELFFDLGRFPEPAVFNEDLIFAAKCVQAGYSVAYVADAEVFHSHNYTIRQQFRRYFDNGVSFRMNSWMLPYSSIGKEGLGMVKLQFKGIVKSWKWGLVFRLFAESAAKWLGFQLGKRYTMLPEAWRGRFSLQPGFWGKMAEARRRSEIRMDA